MNRPPTEEEILAGDGRFRVRNKAGQESIIQCYPPSEECAVPHVKWAKGWTDHSLVCHPVSNVLVEWLGPAEENTREPQEA